MQISLNSGPFDRQVVESVRRGAAIPDGLEFGRDRSTVMAKWKYSPRGSTMDWRFSEAQTALDAEPQPELYAAHYGRTNRSTPEGASVFDFISEVNARQ